MPVTPSSTAILFFTRTPEEEVRHKTYIHSAGRRANTQVARKLIQNTRKAIAGSGLPAFVVTSRSQQGATFGERLAAAFQDVFDKGFDRVIAIGNDTLTLSSADLLNASSLLDQHAAVIGPTPHGGTYLVGMRKSAFASEQFSALPWETDLILERLVSSISEATQSVALLPYQSDVNTPSDLLSQYRLLLKHSALYTFISYLLFTRSILKISRQVSYGSPLFYTSISLRAPPTHIL